MDTSEWILIIVIFALFALFVVKTFYFNPAYPRIGEGFYGGVARSAGHPDCLRTLPEGSELLDMVSKRVKGYPSDGSTDYKEMELLLSKMACLKKDLLSPSGIVNATRHQAIPFHLVIWTLPPPHGVIAASFSYESYVRKPT